MASSHKTSNFIILFSDWKSQCWLCYYRFSDKVWRCKSSISHQLTGFHWWAQSAPPWYVGLFKCILHLLYICLVWNRGPYNMASKSTPCVFLQDVLTTMHTWRFMKPYLYSDTRWALSTIFILETTLVQKAFGSSRTLYIARALIRSVWT